MSESTHRRVLEPNAKLFALLSTVGVSIGGLVEIVPMFGAAAGPAPMAEVTPYSPLELAGRDIYIREGCYNCHSQMIRPMRAETMRYGPWTRAGEYQWDHPFQLGSRRIGPDLQRVGGKYPNAWHFDHMKDPRQITAGSIMPAYSWLYDQRYTTSDIVDSVGAMITLGVPYDPNPASWVPAKVEEQSKAIVADLAASKRDAAPDDEIIALISYLQRLGKDGKAAIAAKAAQ
jgi:cytochrome c oxidase cbb3-type subunit I/II